MSKSSTAAHQSPTIPANVSGGSRFHAMRRSARTLADPRALDRPLNGAADGGACQSS
jgi:hypothetical protein